MDQYLNAVIDAVFDGDEDATLEAVNAALAGGVSAQDIINKGGVVALERLGKAFDDMEAFLPDMMLGGECMHALLERVKPLLQRDGQSGSATIVVGCAQGDLHDIGLNLVATQLSVGGFDVINLGTDTTVSQFIDAAKQNDAAIIGISTLLTTSAYYQAELIKALEKQGLRDRFQVIVGGGPITPEWTKRIGADGYSRTANQAVELCRRLVAGGGEKPVIIE